MSSVVGGNSYRAFGPPGGGFCRTRPFTRLDTLDMSTLYAWEKVVLVLIALASFVAGFQSGGAVDGVMALAVDTLIVFALFKVGNKFFGPKPNEPKT